MKNYTKIDRFYRSSMFGWFLLVMVIIGLTLSMIYKIYGPSETHSTIVDIYVAIFGSVVIIGLLNPLFYKKPKE